MFVERLKSSETINIRKIIRVYLYELPTLSKKSTRKAELELQISHKTIF